MAKYPIYLELSSRRTVVIGAGPVAMRKARSLLAAGARVVVVADKIDDMLSLQSSKGKAELIKSKYSRSYLAGAVLVIAATNDLRLNSRIYRDCQELEILCNVADQPELCDFFVPAIVKRGDLQIAIGTEGNCPAYAGHLRKKLESLFTEQHGRFLVELEKLRKQVIESVPVPVERKVLLGKLVEDESFEYFIENGPVAWHERADKIISEHKAEQ